MIRRVGIMTALALALLGCVEPSAPPPLALIGPGSGTRWWSRHR